MKDSTRLILVKLLHTVAWAFFAGCTLLLKRWTCPLTDVAARYKRPNSEVILKALSLFVQDGKHPRYIVGPGEER